MGKKEPIGNGQRDFYHVKTDFMKKRNCSLRECAKRLAEFGQPTDYLHGRRRPAEEAPDNLLLFVRRSPEELRGQAAGQTFFHHRWVLIVPLRGKGEVQVGHRSVSLRPHEAILVPPLSLHQYGKVAARMEWLFLSFDWPGHAAAEAGEAESRRLTRGARESLWQLIEEMADREEDSGENGGVAAAHALHLIRQLYPLTQERGRGKGTILEITQRAVETGTCRRVEELAQHARMSESHLRACFRRQTGISLGRYLRESRLRMAALWLKEEGLTVKEAAERCGYPDAFTFSRAFKKVVGVPPSQIGASTHA